MTTALKKPGRRLFSEDIVARKKEEILKAATAIFARDGYRNTDVQEIADALQIGKGTIYRYFPSKKELFLAAVDRGMRRFLKRLETEADKADNKLERIARVIYAYLAFFDSHPEMVELLIQERAEFRDRDRPTFFTYCNSQKEKRVDAFRRLIERGAARDNLPPEGMFDIINNLLYGSMFINFFSGRDKSCAQQAREIADVFFNGILKEGCDSGALEPLMDRIAREYEASWRD